LVPPNDSFDADPRERADGVFVYGTLKSGFGNHQVIKPHVVSIESATVQGLIYDLGPFPAMTLHTNESQTPQTVQGEFVTVNELGSALRDLDRLEGYAPGRPHNLYDCQVTTVTLPNGDTKQACVYVMPMASSRGKLVEPMNGVASWSGRQ